MKIRESIKFKTTTVANLKPYDMFVLASPKVVYMYIMTYHGPKYLELDNGTWKDSMIAFNIQENISIVKIEELEYTKV